MIDTEVNANRRLAIHTGSGALLLEDMQKAMGKLFSHPEFEADFSVVWDLRLCRIDITLAEIIYLSPKIVDAANTARPSGKTAWVTSTAFGETIIQLLYAQFNWAAEWKTFSKLELALAWCRLPS